MATIAAKLPLQIFLRTVAITIVYFLSSQPLEWNRIGMFYSSILILTLVAEGFGMIFGTRLNVVVNIILSRTFVWEQSNPLFQISNGMFYIVIFK